MCALLSSGYFCPHEYRISDIHIHDLWLMNSSEHIQWLVKKLNWCHILPSCHSIGVHVFLSSTGHKEFLYKFCLFLALRAPKSISINYKCWIIITEKLKHMHLGWHEHNKLWIQFYFLLKYSFYTLHTTGHSDKISYLRFCNHSSGLNRLNNITHMLCCLMFSWTSLNYSLRSLHFTTHTKHI